MQRVNFILALAACILGITAHLGGDTESAPTATSDPVTAGQPMRVHTAKALEGTAPRSARASTGDQPTLRAAPGTPLEPLVAELRDLRSAVQQTQAKQKEIASVQAEREEYFARRSRRDLTSLEKLASVLELTASQRSEIEELLATSSTEIEGIRTLEDRDGQSIKKLSEALAKVDWEVDSNAAEKAWMALERFGQNTIPGTDETFGDAIRTRRKATFKRIREGLTEKQQELWDKGYKGGLLPGGDESWIGGDDVQVLEIGDMLGDDG